MADPVIKIDWAWVRERVSAAERIPPRRTSGAKESLSIAVDECLRVARHLADPAAAFSRKRILDIKPELIEAEGGLSIPGRSMAAHIKGAEYLHLFIVTIGIDLEETATVLMEGGEQLHGYLLDRIGSFAVESMAEETEKQLRGSYAAEGMTVSMRFSPGYCDWPIEEQSKLDEAIGFSRAGVRLTDSFMMMPRKSVSGAVGVGPKGLFTKKISQCSICDIKHCDYKR